MDKEVYILESKSLVTSTTRVIVRWRFFQWRNGRTDIEKSAISQLHV